MAKRISAQVGPAIQGHPDRFGLYPIPFQAAQALLTCAAQISKILSPVEGGYGRTKEQKTFAKERGQKLTTILDPPKILVDRFVRNKIEHYDEGLDDILMENPSAHITIMSSVAPDDRPTVVGRMFSHETLEVVVLNESVDLQEVVNAIAEIDKKAQQWLDDNDRVFGGNTARHPR